VGILACQCGALRFDGIASTTVESTPTLGGCGPTVHGVLSDQTLASTAQQLSLWHVHLQHSARKTTISASSIPSADSAEIGLQKCISLTASRQEPADYQSGISPRQSQAGGIQVARKSLSSGLAVEPNRRRPMANLDRLRSLGTRPVGPVLFLQQLWLETQKLMLHLASPSRFHACCQMPWYPPVESRCQIYDLMHQPACSGSPMPARAQLHSSSSPVVWLPLRLAS
jgi:hypothetical protein